ncbi:MAG: hypothetical protein ACI30J_07970 [Paludibacteraceae bacterium]
MKKLFLITFAMCALSVSAQYRYATGPIIGSMYGGSYKMYCSDHIVLQTDLMVGLHAAPGSLYMDNEYNSSFTEHYWDFVLNPNLMYQAPVADVKVGWLNYFVGAGISGGIAMEYGPSYIYGKVGGNAIAGIEYVFEGIPFAISADFRPGYSCILAKYYGIMMDMHMFDWGLGLAFRYYVR